MSNKKKNTIQSNETSLRAAADVLYDMEPVEEPINLLIKAAKPIKIDKLNWTNYETVPKRMKLHNSGTTVVVNAQWRNADPTIKDGPFKEEYIFSQIHFHWGINETEGSSHTIEGKQLPLEMHAIFRKMVYATHEDAASAPYGLVKIVYMFLLKPENNDMYDLIIDALPNIKQALSSCLIEPVPISYFIRDFSADYFFYLGKVEKERCTHILPTIICREPMYISAAQISKFREILDRNSNPLLRNFRRGDNFRLNSIYHINPSNYTQTILNIVTEVKVIENKKKHKKYDSSLINTEINSLKRQKYGYISNECGREINFTKVDPSKTKLKNYNGVKTTKHPHTASKYSLIDKKECIHNFEAFSFDRNDHNEAQGNKTFYLDMDSTKNIKIKTESDSNNNLNVTVAIKPIRLKKLYLPANYNFSSTTDDIEGKDMEEVVKQFAESLFEQIITDAKTQIENTLQEQLIPLLNNQSEQAKKFEQELYEYPIQNMKTETELLDTQMENSNMTDTSKMYNEDHLTELIDKLSINFGRNEREISIDKKCINSSDKLDGVPQKLENMNTIENGFKTLDLQIKTIGKKIVDNYFEKLMQGGENEMEKLVKELKSDVDDYNDFVVPTEKNNKGEGDGSEIEGKRKEKYIDRFENSSIETVIQVKRVDSQNSNLVIRYSVTESSDDEINEYKVERNENFISKDSTKQDLKDDPDMGKSKSATKHTSVGDNVQNHSTKPVDPTSENKVNIKKKQVSFNETVEKPEIIPSKQSSLKTNSSAEKNMVINDKIEPCFNQPKPSTPRRFEKNNTKSHSVTESLDDKINKNFILKDYTKQYLRDNPDIEKSKSGASYVSVGDNVQNHSTKTFDPTSKNKVHIKKKKVSFNETVEKPEIIPPKKSRSKNTVINDKIEPCFNPPKPLTPKKFENNETKTRKQTVRFNDEPEIMGKIITNNKENERTQKRTLKPRSPAKAFSDRLRYDRNKPKWWF